MKLLKYSIILLILINITQVNAFAKNYNNDFELKTYFAQDIYNFNIKKSIYKYSSYYLFFKEKEIIVNFSTFMSFLEQNDMNTNFVGINLLINQNLIGDHYNSDFYLDFYVQEEIYFENIFDSFNNFYSALSSGVLFNLSHSNIIFSFNNNYLYKFNSNKDYNLYLMINSKLNLFFLKILSISLEFDYITTMIYNSNDKNLLIKKIYKNDISYIYQNFYINTSLKLIVTQFEYYIPMNLLFITEYSYYKNNLYIKNQNDIYLQFNILGNMTQSSLHMDIGLTFTDFSFLSNFFYKIEFAIIF